MAYKVRFSFFHESTFAQVGSSIPKNLGKINGAIATWSASNVVGELVRESKFSKHIQHPRPPISIFGIPVEELREREKTIYELASKEVETYVRKGKSHTRVQRKTIPILLLAVASWPEPTMEPSEDRARWVRRVIRLAKSRWGKLLRSVVAHEDEAFFHLHLWIDDSGKPVKRHHAGHGAVIRLQAVQPESTRKVLAAEYIKGVSLVQDWYHSKVGVLFGWQRNSPSPRQRLVRTVALRERQAAVESMEAELLRQKNALELAKSEVLNNTILMKKALERLHEREVNLSEKYALLREHYSGVMQMSDAIKNQLALEKILHSNQLGISRFS